MREHTFERDRGKVVTLVDDHVTVVGKDVVGGFRAHEVLNHRNVELTVWATFACTDLSDVSWIDAEEDRELRDPLIQQRLPVDKDQRATGPRRDEIGADDRLTDARRRDEDTDVMREDRTQPKG